MKLPLGHPKKAAKQQTNSGISGDVILTETADIKSLINAEAAKLGFTSTRIGPARVAAHERARLDAWLSAGHHGSMSYMAHHAELRKDPQQLVPGALSSISVRLPYWPTNAKPAQEQLADVNAAYLSRYALGRDYHKVIRQRLQALADRLTAQLGGFNYRVFSDSAPVMEVALATQSGLGWKGKHTLSLDRCGSWYFLGEIICDLPLPYDAAISGHCGDCNSCMTHCPTGAITAAHQVDARRCISYLTIEHTGEIPVEFRQAIGNRIYGCDDCQLVCPWNRFSPEGDREFAPRHGLDAATLLELFQWQESEFLQRFEGSAIRRIGYERWQRNLAIALGNSRPSAAHIQALKDKRTQSSTLVQSHIDWALAQLTR